jgi:hypothetical protein
VIVHLIVLRASAPFRRCWHRCSAWNPSSTRSARDRPGVSATVSARQGVHLYGWVVLLVVEVLFSRSKVGVCTLLKKVPAVTNCNAYVAPI